MSLRVTAAVSGAGFVAKDRQEVARKGEDGLLEQFCKDLNQKKPEVASLMDKQSIDQKRVESGGSIFSRFIQRQLAENASSNRGKIAASLQGRFSETCVDASLEGDCTSGIDGDTLVSPGEYVRDHSSLLSLQPWVFRKEIYLHDDEEMNAKCEFSDKRNCGTNGFADASQTELSQRSIKPGYGPGRSRSSLRSRRTRRYSVRQLTSMGNCLIPQLYSDHFEIEDYVFNSLQSRAAPTMKPLIITDGNRIISRSCYAPMGNPLENSLHKEVNGVSSRIMETAIGVPSLPELRKPKRTSMEVQHERLDTSISQRSCKLLHSQGSPDRMLLLCLGISIGVIFSYLSNKREVEKMNNLLKDTENLVHDLQEELEMKESLTVKELSNEYYFPGQERDQDGQLDSPKVVANSDSMSRIEAELEAELKRLELNINATCSEGTVSSLGEVDSDLVADVVHGELRADMLDSGVQECRTDPCGDSSSTSTAHTHNHNHAVSPRQLSLRLHEVLKIRLEERIEELERELQDSQKQLRLMEAEQALFQGSLSNSNIGSSNQESTTGSDPMCLNLSGDALDAYDEAYEEFMRMTDTEETLQSTNHADLKLYGDGFHPSDRCLIWGMEGGSEIKSSTEIDCLAPWEQIMRSRGYDDAEESDGGGHEHEIDDEDGKMIQRIVERTRQGLPVVIHAQRMFFSPDD